MNYQGTAYSFNQRGEILLPTRSGTTYYGAQNHKPLYAYTGLDHDIEFYVINSDRKPVNLNGKTFVAKIVDRESNSVRVTKTLVPVSNQTGLLIMKLTGDNTSSLDFGLYDLFITYTDGDGRTFGLQSDQNARISYVLEVKENPLVEVKSSFSDDTFTQNGDNYYSSRFAGTAQSYNADGTNTVVVYTTNYTGEFYAQGSLESNPTENDWFNIELDPDQYETEWQFSAETGLTPFTFDGMFMWVRFYHTPDVANTGTLDKILYRN